MFGGSLVINANKKNTKPKKSKNLTAEQLAIKKEQARQKRVTKKYESDIRAIFKNADFKSIPVAKNEFEFKGRTTELDHLFIYENVIVIAEDTQSKDVGTHLLKKKIIFDLINNHPAELVDFLKELSPDFKAYFESHLYSSHQYLVRIAYFSRHQIDQEHMNQFSDVSFIEYPLLKYFLSLSKTIGKTSRFELLKFFDIRYSQIGAQKVRGQTNTSTRQYQGFLLPEANSNYPKGYKVLSFYIDPATLLERSYVLRKDSWEDPSCAYQRMLEHKKIRSMRKYLNDTQRVYVNNLIVTLPPTTKFTSPNTGQSLQGNALNDNQHVLINLPDEFNVIGLIDGQHRVYSYHEGVDSYELGISKLRQCQNLLVTAIMYPQNVPDLERTIFEATLFLEINDEQTKARGDLKQAIELIVRPFSTTAISKAIIANIARNGPLKGMLEEHYFDEKEKIKTSSIVSYGLKPLVKLSGDDSLYSAWNHENKVTLLANTDKALLQNYIEFSASKINDLLVGFKSNIPSDRWSRENKVNSVLSPTTINGFIVCLRELIKNDLIGDIDYYKKQLQGIENFDFSQYKSSHWKQLGLAIYEKYFKTN